MLARVGWVVNARMSISIAKANFYLPTGEETAVSVVGPEASLFRLVTCRRRPGRPEPSLITFVFALRLARRAGGKWR